MDLIKHAKEFERIIVKYDLAGKAEEIADYILKKRHVDVKEFAILFNLSEDDAKILISFIAKGIEFKKRNIDQHT